MDTKGRHLLVEYYGCENAILNNVKRVEALLEKAANEAGATVVQSVFHRFAPQGVSGVVVIEESHLSIHTWPEAGYAAVDFYTCGDCEPEKAHQVLLDGLSPEHAEVMYVERGLPGSQSMMLQEHRVDGGAPDFGQSKPLRVRSGPTDEATPVRLRSIRGAAAGNS